MASLDSSVTTSNPPVPRQTPGGIAPEPITTPTHGTGGVFTIIASTHINAPVDTVFEVLVNHAQWPEWNRFVRKVTVKSTPSSFDTSTFAPVDQDDGAAYLKKGQAVGFQVHMDAENPSSYSLNQSMEITLLEPFDKNNNKKKGWRVAWKATSFPGFALRSERVQEVVDDGKGGTEYTCWETMYGPLAYAVKLTQGSVLEKNFRIWGEDLKARSEKIATG